MPLGAESGCHIACGKPTRRRDGSHRLLGMPVVAPLDQSSASSRLRFIPFWMMSLNLRLAGRHKRSPLPRLPNSPSSLARAPRRPTADHLQTSQCFAPAQAAGSNQARDLALTQPRFALLPEVDGRCQTARRLKPGDGPLGGPKQDRVLRIAAARLVRVGCFV